MAKQKKQDEDEPIEIKSSKLEKAGVVDMTYPDVRFTEQINTLTEEEINAAQMLHKVNMR